MTAYDLICGLGHAFEGWFPTFEAFEAQAKEGLVQCTICGNTEVTRVPSGVHFQSSPLSMKRARGRNPWEKGPLPPPPKLDPNTVAKTLRHWIKNHSDDVGKQFAELARQMDAGDINFESIFGEVTPEEPEDLAEDELSCMFLPDFPPEYEN